MKQLDHALLLALNSHHTPWLDAVAWAATHTLTWTPLFVALIVVAYRRFQGKAFIAFAAILALCILTADQTAAHLLKPLLCRARPTHCTELQGMITTVRGYVGGAYGFPSAHAANTFATATYVASNLKGRKLTLTLFAWAALVSWTRIYLGVHFPSDIAAGAMLGAAVGYAGKQLFQYTQQRCRG